MTELVIAEKPSVARDIARVLGAHTRGDGCLRGNGWCITWALGHLVHFAEPDDYGSAWAARWSMAQLPMVPEHWRLTTDPRTASQFKIVKALLLDRAISGVICATDAGREGELIFRLIAEQAGCRKPVRRLWISSLTDEAIRDGFARLRPGQDYEALAAAARARAQADWLVGMNLTRAYTVHNRVLCTIGRVQTPTLALIVARDATIANFTKAFFYELVARLAEGFEATYVEDGESRLDTREYADRRQREISQAIAPQQLGTVVKIERKVRTNHPPPLYDLTTLQREANRRFGFTAAKVLELAQALYETHKLISYPRTESHHLGTDMLPQLPKILAAVTHPCAADARQRLAAGHTLGKAYVDTTKLTDHHAIIPTAKSPPAQLPEPLQQIYALVATRFVAIFLPPQRVEETLVTLAIGGATFVAKGAVELDPGWKRAEVRRSAPAGAAPDGEGGGESGPTALPPLREQQSVTVDALEVREKETQPPRPYDDASLLSAMKNAGRTLDDDALAAAMKGSGLGTPATRAETIEKLVRTGYVERQRKQLRATEKGRALIGLVAEELRSVELTAAWEQRLKDIEQGNANAASFYQDICQFVTALIPRVSQGAVMPAAHVEAARAKTGKGRSAGRRQGGKSGRPASGAGQASADALLSGTALSRCPICQQGEITATDKAIGCSRWREGCGFTVWKTIAGHVLSPEELQTLLTRGYTDPIEGLRAKSGRTFRAAVRLDASGKTVFAFPPAAGDHPEPALPPAHNGMAPVTGLPPTAAGLKAAPVPCPLCHQGVLIEGRSAFGCGRWREGCTFVIPKTLDGQVVTDPQLRALAREGRSPLGVDAAGHERWLALDPAGRVVVRTK